MAASYLEKRGFSVLTHNYRKRSFEIDLIARKSDIIIFVEVKRRSSSAFVEPIKIIDTEKKKNIIKGSKYYLLVEDLYGKVDIRYDVILITGKHEQIEHFEDVFRLD